MIRRLLLYGCFGVDISTTFISKVMCIFLFAIGAMAAILEKGHFLAYATNFGIPPRKLLKVVVFCT